MSQDSCHTPRWISEKGISENTRFSSKKCCQHKSGGFSRYTLSKHLKYWSLPLVRSSPTGFRNVFRSNQIVNTHHIFRLTVLHWNLTVSREGEWMPKKRSPKERFIKWYKFVESQGKAIDDVLILLLLVCFWALAEKVPGSISRYLITSASNSIDYGFGFDCLFRHRSCPRSCGNSS